MLGTVNQLTKLSTVANLQASITFQPIAKDIVSHTLRTEGNPQDVDISRAHLAWIFENRNGPMLQTIREFTQQQIADIQDLVPSKFYDAKYLYMNDAGEELLMFYSYPDAKFRRMKAIHNKYHPPGVYTHLLSKGWKTADA
ncbi:predicted protein [Plenodomus lingam JN3]|uniref:Predicted protein n=1 Tax=Leptosphaeria maculans (strain JN3 / isolate v23.1.3 / race Av1-4-5-6-7-8) TaxID=985895 RepID=E4ZW75_LEPMJ|nr:predicted protein [Plenodomus lingam JN3]CBX95851.1 predicted protein [Plenodomus lingam JN3]